MASSSSSTHFQRGATPDGHSIPEVVSALQKAVRRSEEEPACYWAMELFRTGFGEHCFKRLRIICSEDVGLAWPEGPAVIRALYDNYRDAIRGKRQNQGERLFLLHAVCLLCRAPKSRIIDNAVMYFSRETQLFEIPDEAVDQHTLRGKRQGRGVSHFFEEGTRLVPEPTLEDPYRERAWEAVKRLPKLKGQPPQPQESMDFEG
jgi:replication-associated recombination protein RarA